ncbi:RHS repeat-associated core domain-containing protein [Pseudomonas asiatica]|uniref:RHS repeat-associated core domain-containing protein n=1 Tax=Pseudomonas asiatica TaxID=2219225 RepID=UPI00383BBADA
MSTSSSSRNKHALASRQSLHFYKDDHLATEVATQGNRHVLWANDVALAQLDQSQSAEMLRVDLANSVLGLASESMAYSPYGYLPMEKMLALLGFNGQWCDPITEGYPLGAGRRTYSTERMRFDSDDPTSPFGKGGPHPSAYCEGDPINRHDPTGEFFQFLVPLTRGLASTVGRRLASTVGRGLVSARNFNINGMTGNTAAMGPKSHKTLNFIESLFGQQKTTVAIPVKPQSHLFAQAPQQNVNTTVTSALVSAPAPLSKTQDPISAPIKVPQQEQVFNRPGYGRRDSSNFAGKTIVGFAAALGGGATALYFGLKAIRKN